MAGGKSLILGGIRSGKSAYAESLLERAEQVRYVATAGHDDAEFAERVAAHRFRRPASWETVEAGADPSALLEALAKADPGVCVLVDDLGGWATALLARADRAELVARLTTALRDCPAQVILVSPEVGLSVVPPTRAGVQFADLVGELNQSIATECDEVILIVAGQPTWLKGPTPPDAAAQSHLATPLPATAVGATNPAAAANPADPASAPSTPAMGVGGEERSEPREETVFTESTRALPIVETGLTIGPGMDLPIHDDQARTNAERHLSSLDIKGSGLGSLARTVVFAAGTQGRAIPAPWRKPYMLLLHGRHEGDVAAGDDVAVAAQVAQQARIGEGPIGQLAAGAEVTLRVVDAPTAGDIAYGRAADTKLIATMLKDGWQLTDDAVDSGADLIIVGSCGAGADAAAAAVTARITGAEIAALLARITGPDGIIDDSSWMLRCAAIRDALHRSRHANLNADTILSELGGPDLALIAGIILGATARRTPVLLDGPVGTASALLARDLGSQSRQWCALADFGGHPTTRAAADVLGLVPLLDLQVGLGEGAMSLIALPLMRSALNLSAALPTMPVVLSAPPESEDDRYPTMD